MNSQINNDAPFKVGGIYRQRDGEVVRLEPHKNPARAKAISLGLASHRVGTYMADVSLLNGSAGGVEEWERDFDLLPGEVDEAGNPVNQSAKAMPYQLVSYGQSVLSPGKPVDLGDLSKVARFFDAPVYVLRAETETDEGYARRVQALRNAFEADNHIEPIRPPLTWNKPGPSFADKQFPGYVVTRSGPDDLDAWFSQGKP